MKFQIDNLNSQIDVYVKRLKQENRYQIRIFYMSMIVMKLALSIIKTRAL